jgi:hypothetical protein
LKFNDAFNRAVARDFPRVRTLAQALDLFWR